VQNDEDVVEGDDEDDIVLEGVVAIGPGDSV
jgi:hypothetical protein